MVSVDRSASRTFVVTGAASGIGLATARWLLAEGGTVVGTDLAAPAENLGERFEFVAADITDETAVAAVFAAIPGRVDGVVHSAGVAGGGPVHLLDRTEWQRVQRVQGRRRVAHEEHCARLRSQRNQGKCHLPRLH